MKLLRINLPYFFLLVLVTSIALQFDYVFFNIYFFVPFFVVVIVALGTFLLLHSYINQIIFFLLLVSILFVTTLIIVFSGITELKRTLIYPFYIILSVFITNNLLYSLNKIKIKKIIELTMLVCVLAVLIETFFRFYMPTLDLRGDTENYINSVTALNPTFVELLTGEIFYAFKFSSIMFFDSNFVGLFLLPILVLNLFYIEMNKTKAKRFKLLLLVVLFLIALTFSRAAMLTAVIVLYLYCMYKIMHYHKQVFFITVCVSIFAFSAGLIHFHNLLIQDGSFITKISIFNSLSTIFEHDLNHIFFGYGLDVGGTIYSYQKDSYAHALIPVLLGQFGLLGLCIYFSFVIYMSFKIGFFGWLLFIAIFVSGLSLTDPWQILNYFSFLIMAHYIRVNNYENSLCR